MKENIIPAFQKSRHCDCLQPGCPYCDPMGKLKSMNNEIIKKINEQHLEKNIEKLKTMNEFKNVQELIQKLSDERYSYIDKMDESFDPSIGKYGDYTYKPDEIIDDLGDKILDIIKKEFNNLPFEFIFEELTKLGHSPNLVYDDNGNFAITGDGYQKLSSTYPEDITILNFVEKNQWKKTVREALSHYLFSE